MKFCKQYYYYQNIIIIFAKYQIIIIVVFHYIAIRKNKNLFFPSVKARKIIKQALLSYMSDVNTQMIHVCEREDERNSTAYLPAIMAGCIDRTKCSWKHDKLETLFARSFIGRMACVRAYELASSPTLQRVLGSSLPSVSRNFVMPSLCHVF